MRLFWLDNTRTTILCIAVLLHVDRVGSIEYLVPVRRNVSVAEFRVISNSYCTMPDATQTVQIQAVQASADNHEWTCAPVVK